MGMARVSKRDVNGTPLKRGDCVKYLGAPSGYWSGLSRTAQKAIAKRVGKRHAVEGFDAYGHAEFMFRDDARQVHFIWVTGNCLEKVPNRPRRTAVSKPLR